MEPQNQQQQQNEDGGGSGKGNGFLCRQSSTRWTPTTDQIRILKDLYYNNGVRSPSAEQIQRISARLRQYGKIEGKNVFYWFQNHKARERQKKRFTSDSSPAVSMQRGGGVSVSNVWKPDHEAFHNKFPNISHGVCSASPSSASTLTVGQNMGNYGYGSVTMEKNFRDCSISAGGSSTGVGGGSLSHNFGWVGVDPYSPTYSFIDKRKVLLDEYDDEEEEDEASPEIETLPLFPMRGEDINGIKHNSHGYYSGWYRPSEDGGNRGGSRTSLELSLNSYSRRSPDSL